MYKIEETKNTILNGDALSELKKLPDESMNCVVTSPPYWNLRDYQIEGQIGLEESFEEYVSKLCDIFDEVSRVLRDDGTLWVNLGDTYNSHSCGKGNVGGIEGKRKNKQDNRANTHKNFNQISDKSLVMIPFRFAIEMVNRGWILRNTIIWHKNSCMPSSVRDRFTVDFEYLFFFSKKKKYYFEQQFEPYEQSMNRWGGEELKAKGSSEWDKGTGQVTYRERNMRPNKKGRNKRTTWTINPKPFKEAHFAVFPPELVRTPIKAGCPKEICVECEKPKILESESENKTRTRKVGVGQDNFVGTKGRAGETNNIIKGYKPTCKCNAGFRPGIVLDPFMGAGTTGLEALNQGKNFIGIELSKDYIEIAKKRLKPYLEQTKLNTYNYN